VANILRSITNISRMGGAKESVVGELRKAIPHLRREAKNVAAPPALGETIGKILQKQAYYNPLRSEGTGSLKALGGYHTNPFKPSQMQGYQNEFARGIRPRMQAAARLTDAQREAAMRRWIRQVTQTAGTAIPGAAIGGLGGLLVGGPLGAAGGAALGGLTGAAYGGRGLARDWMAREVGI